MDTKPEIVTIFGQCKCCLHYGYLKHMWSEHIWNGEREIYGDMLMNTFGVAWEAEGEGEHICESCITRLRDACSFKKELLSKVSESFNPEDTKCEKFEEANNDMPEHAVNSTDNIDEQSVNGGTDDDCKFESPYQKDDEDTMDEEMLDEESVDNFEQIEFLEEDAELVEKSCKTKLTETSDSDSQPKTWVKRKKGAMTRYKNYTRSELKNCLSAVMNETMTQAEAAAAFNIPKKTVNAKINMLKKRQTDETRSTRKKASAGRAANDTNLVKHRYNIQTVLKWSTATPIRCHTGRGYGCYFCDEKFAKPVDLKSHTFMHGNCEDQIRIKAVCDYAMKLDITDLECKICEQKIDTLEDLITHLNQHKKIYHTDINSHIIPFKFESDVLACVVCKKLFVHFKFLLEHMVQHYKNYQCDVCKRGFINKRYLRCHMNRHELGKFECECGQRVFDWKAKLRSHQLVFHTYDNKSRKCRYCPERFVSTIQRNKHEVERHNFSGEICSCDTCGKTFNSRLSMRYHVRRHHLMLRPFNCPECDKNFFAKSDLKEHMVKHTKERNFQCQVCLKGYGRRKALREHMRIHNNDYRFKCDKCGQAFIQKCRWKDHMSSKHRTEVV